MNNLLTQREKLRETVSIAHLVIASVFKVKHEPTFSFSSNYLSFLVLSNIRSFLKENVSGSDIAMEQGLEFTVRNLS